MRREDFAAAALPGIANDGSPEQVAARAFRIADAMLNEGRKPRPTQTPEQPKPRGFADIHADGEEVAVPKEKQS